MITSTRSGRLRQSLAFGLLAVLAVLAIMLASSGRLEPADFTFNNGAEVSTLDPATVSGVPEGRVVRLLFEGLCVKDSKTLEALPGMATSWDISEDGVTYTFHMREDARWTDGNPVTAYDFEFAWRRMLNPLTAAEYAYQLWYIEGGKEYSLFNDELEYFTDLGLHFWLQEQEGGRVRVGADHRMLAELEQDAALALQVDVGGRLESGAMLVRGGNESYGLPFAVSDAKLNPDLSNNAGELALDPYGDASWCAEFEVDSNLLAGLRESGALISGKRFRETVFNQQWLGLRALDEKRFEVTLKSPTPYFLAICSFYPVFPVSRANIESAQEKWPNSWELKWMRPENLVTNGPFKIVFRRVNDRIRFEKNEDYWDANNVAMQTVDALAIDHLGTSLNLYLMGEIDWIDRPITNVIPRMMPREDFNPAPYLGSYFYRINVNKKPFDDPRVRRALALAIDREAIVTNITKAGEQIAYGFVPPGMQGYRLIEMEHAQGDTPEAVFNANLKRAKQLLAEAGFGEGGADFPTFEIHYNTDQTHKDIAEVIADGWKRHLGLNVKLLNQEWKVYLDAQKSLDYKVTRSAWIGDYPDPNTFLDMFVTGGENNRTGWGSTEYDALIAAAAAESDPALRMQHFAAAEAILMDELPILPIYYYVTRNLVNPRLGGFHANIQDEHFGKFWYWMNDAELAAKRAAQPADWETVIAPGPSEGMYSPAASH
ncbi:MAG: oligopeptide transport system substrate-binding protein [Candidatus Paceibacteria bacterium]